MGANDLQQAITLHRPAAPVAPKATDRWSVEAIQALLDKPFMELLFEAQTVHREHFPPATSSWPRCCRSRPAAAPRTAATARSRREFDTGVKAQKLMEVDEVVRAAQAAKDAGATRFCMGAAWRAPKDRDVEKVAVMVEAVKALGLETCATLGMLEPHQAAAAQGRGPRLLQPQPRHGARVLRRRDLDTRTYQDRLDTLAARARRRHQRVLRRHRRHGRDARRSAPG